MRRIEAICQAVSEPIGNLITYRAMPTTDVPMNKLDPFIFLNHHGWQEYPPNNSGLPFGPHPHRGFETVTFILEGDLMHKDSSGASSVIKEGGVQWMTAGSGLIHAEISSSKFKAKGGPLEILQLWVNLPAAHKMTRPDYTGLQKVDIPELQWDEGRVTANIIAGNWNGEEAPIHPLTDIHLATLYFKERGKLSISIPGDQQILLYVVKGAIHVNASVAEMHHLVIFSEGEGEIVMEATEPSILLFGYATPFREPFVAYGPFVMNTEEEIHQAYEDYNDGKLGDARKLI